MSDILVQLKAPKLYGMASCYTELRQQNTPGTADSFDFANTLLNQLLQAETTERNIRSIRYQTQAARFPVQRHLLGFDFGQSKVDQQLIQQLATMEFTTAAQNLVLVDGTGTGKTHLAIGIGTSGNSITTKRYASSAPLTWPIAWNRKNQRANKAGLPCDCCRSIWSSLMNWAYLPFSQTGGALLFHLLSRL